MQHGQSSEFTDRGTKTYLAECVTNDRFPKTTRAVKNAMKAERRYIYDITLQLSAG